MTGVRFDSIDEYNDIAMKNKYKEEVEKGRDPQEVLESLRLLTRDNSRTPIQWDDTENAGFTTGKPWIKVNPNYKEINVEQALADPNSVFYFYQKLIQLRKENEVIVYGTYETLLDDHEQIYAYVRELEGERWLVVLNVSDQDTTFELPESVSFNSNEVILANYTINETGNISSFLMKPYEARIYRLIKN